MPGFQRRILTPQDYARRNNARLPAAQRILNYLPYTRLKGITLTKAGGLDLKAYAADSDIARMEEDRRSVSGVVVTCAGTAVSWSLILQRCVTLLPPKEFEYIPVGDGIKEGLLMPGLLSFMVPNIRKRMIHDCGDNHGAIDQLVNDLQSSARSRSNSDVSYHIVRHFVEMKTFEIEYAESRSCYGDTRAKHWIENSIENSYRGMAKRSHPLLSGAV